MADARLKPVAVDFKVELTLSLNEAIFLTYIVGQTNTGALTDVYRSLINELGEKNYKPDNFPQKK